MRVSELEYSNLKQDIVDKILFDKIEDLNDKGDCILVLGSNTANLYRVPKAVEIYNAKRANKVLMSHGKITIGNESINGANSMKKKAIELGILEEDILIEDSSLTTKENMICSLLVLERNFKLCNIKKILLVTTRYHMRRSLLMAKTYMPDWIEFSPCPADDINTLRHNWFLTEKSSKRARDEAYKIISYIREGSIADFEI